MVRHCSRVTAGTRVRFPPVLFARKERERKMKNITIEEVLRYYTYDYTVEISNGEVVGLSKEQDEE